VSTQRARERSLRLQYGAIWEQIQMPANWSR
jgi:hypothetical protein